MNGPADHHDRPAAPAGPRVDLHCHSIASNRPTEAALKLLKCPECYSEPEAVYAQARSRGMRFVTVTDHDCLDGVLRLAGRSDVLPGVELTAFFPEDRCKLHILVWGLTPHQHADLQQRADDIYEVAAYLESGSLAHAVAHPVYRQNDKLERWHLERLMLLFKGFECLNGAHSPLHREAFEPLLERLTPDEIARLADRHSLRPRWPEPHIKARTGGSDDHGLLNVGCTWTLFPEGTQTTDQLLDHLRHGRCAPGGESGSAVKLAHTFYSVAVRYYTRQVLPAGQTPSPSTRLLQALVGEGVPPTPAQLRRQAIARKLRHLASQCIPPILRRKRPDERPALRDLFIAAAKTHLRSHPELLNALSSGLPPLADRDAVFRFVSAINQDVSQGLASSIGRAIDQASYTALFDSIAAILGQQFALFPYFFAMFHQNKERRLLRSLTGQIPPPTAGTLRVGLFTDTLDEVNGVSRFLRELSACAQRCAWKLTIATCAQQPLLHLPHRHNFAPLFSHELPYYPEIRLNLPPILDVMEFAERQQFDVIHVSTPGPMGLMGLLVSRMLRIPCLATYHTDFPAYAHDLTGDHRVVRGTDLYLRWFYQRMERIFARSREYRSSLQGFNLPPDRLSLVLPTVNTATFHPGRKDSALWKGLNIPHPFRILYAGRLSKEKNLGLLVDAFARLCADRSDVALVLAGDGPARPELQSRCAGLPVFFLGVQTDAALATLYASSDLLAFPSRTDTLGQVVLEALASGLPALVSNEGGPQELVDDGVTGRVLSPSDPVAWASAIDRLLSDAPLRQSMSHAATQRIAQLSLDRSLEQFWSEHLQAAWTPSAPSLQSGGEPAALSV